MVGMKDTYFGDKPYPDRPGFKVDGTSKDAAGAVAPRAGTLRERVLDVLRRRAMTADEVADEIGATVLATRPRLSELAKKGLIERTGHRRANESGVLADVWRSKE